MPAFVEIILVIMISFVFPVGMIFLAIYLFARVKKRLSVDKNRKAYLDDGIRYLYRKQSKTSTQFSLDRNLMKAINKRQNIDKDLELLMLQILQHMKAPLNGVQLHIVRSNFDSYRVGGTAARYGKTSYQNREIEIFLRDDQKAIHIAAILIHECAHYYMDYKNIHAQDGYDEEILTDEATVFLGFYRIMHKAYAPKSKVVRDHRGQDIQYNSKVGYLTDAEIDYCNRSIKKIGRKEQSKTGAEEAGKTAQEKKQAAIAFAKKRLMEQILNMDLLYSKLTESLSSGQLTPRTYTEAEWQSVQQLMLSAESGTLSGELNELKKSSQAAVTMEQIDIMTRHVQQFCTQLQYWTSLIV